MFYMFLLESLTFWSNIATGLKEADEQPGGPNNLLFSSVIEILGVHFNDNDDESMANE